MKKTNLFKLLCLFPICLSQSLLAGGAASVDRAEMPAATSPRTTGRPPAHSSSSATFHQASTGSIVSPRPAVLGEMPDAINETGVIFDTEHGRHIVTRDDVGADRNLFQVVAQTRRGTATAGLITIWERHERRENINIRDADGRTPLFYAQIDTLVDDMVTRYGADITIQDNRGLTALDYHVRFYDAGTEEARVNIHGPIILRLATAYGDDLPEQHRSFVTAIDEHQNRFKQLEAREFRPSSDRDRIAQALEAGLNPTLIMRLYDRHFQEEQARAGEPRLQTDFVIDPAGVLDLATPAIPEAVEAEEEEEEDDDGAAAPPAPAFETPDDNGTAAPPDSSFETPAVNLVVTHRPQSRRGGRRAARHLPPIVDRRAAAHGGAGASGF